MKRFFLRAFIAIVFVGGFLVAALPVLGQPTEKPLCRPDERTDQRHLSRLETQ
jgi:hypothetical protein